MKEREDMKFLKSRSLLLLNSASERKKKAFLVGRGYEINKSSTWRAPGTLTWTAWYKKIFEWNDWTNHFGIIYSYPLHFELFEYSTLMWPTHAITEMCAKEVKP